MEGIMVHMVIGLGIFIPLGFLITYIQYKYKKRDKNP